MTVMRSLISHGLRPAVIALLLAPLAAQGSSVCRLADVDDDSVADIAIASRLTAKDEFVAVLSGRDGKLLRIWHTKERGDGFGAVFAPLRGPKTTALVVLVRGMHTQRTESTINPIQVGKPQLVRLDAESGTRTLIDVLLEPACVTCIDDFDGDGELDLLLGSSRSRPRPSVRSGSDGKALLELPLRLPESEGTLFFVDGSVSGYGDLDRDGRMDWAIGAPTSNASTWARPVESADASKPTSSEPSASDETPGCVLVCSGKTGETLATSRGTRSNDQLGAVVVPLDDLDGDGLPELAAVALSRYVRVLGFDAEKRELRTLFELPSHTDGGKWLDDFGSTVSPLADVDGDGTPDIVTGADERMPDGSFFNEGYADVWSGKTGARIGTIFESDTQGVDVCGLPDVDGKDGPDVALSIVTRAPDGSEGSLQVVRVVSAKDGRKVWEIDVAALVLAQPTGK